MSWAARIAFLYFAAGLATTLILIGPPRWRYREWAFCIVAWPALWWFERFVLTIKGQHIVGMERDDG